MSSVSRGNQAEQEASGLLKSWREAKPEQLDLDRYRSLGRLANNVGESLLACDIANEGLQKSTSDRSLRQIKALALSRLGSLREAQQILTELSREAADEETTGLLARTYKGLWIETGDPKDLDQAFNAYAKGYNDWPESYWMGINAATLAYARGDGQTAVTIATQIRDKCLEKLETSSLQDRYWLPAMLGESSLILEDYDVAEGWYTEFGRTARNDFGNLATTRRNARIILKPHPPDLSSRIERALDMPAVVLFTGHRIDEPDRARLRFPPAIAAAVRDTIQKRLVEMNARVGFSSAASGSDILFLEAMQAIGGQTQIVLPCDEEHFVQESIASSGGDWRERFQAVIGKAGGVHIASKQRLTFGSIAYDYSNELLHGLATVRADQLETKLVRLAVWDKKPGYGPGGTADIVGRWQEAGHAVSIINPLDFLDPSQIPPAIPRDRTAQSPASAAATTPGFASEILTMVFADAYHFSHLAEDQMPAFIRNFMGPVAGLVADMKPAPLFQNTWGDGLFFVFGKVGDAGRFALRLADRVARIDRQAAGLPEKMSLRIALHVGPVYRFTDQITGRLNYIGSHVNRAARIEPITPPGKVYGSEAFAAFATLESPGQFRFDYVGRIPLAKDFGDYPMYHVQRSN